MLSFDKWKQQFNENFGLLGGVIGGIRTPQSVASPVVQGTVDTNAFRTLGDSFPESSAPKWMGTEIKMEDDVEDENQGDEEADDVDEIEEVDMEDVEDEEGDDEEESDMEDEDMGDEGMEDKDMGDEGMEDENMSDEDMGDESESKEDDNMIHHHHMHHHHHMQEEGAKHSKDKCSKCGAKYMEKNTCMKCGAYMKTESTNYSNIPSLEEWQKSVASMYDPKFFDKNYDGISNINEALASNVKKALTKADAAAENIKGKQNNIALAVAMLKNLFKQFKKMNPEIDFNGIKKLINQALITANNQIQKEEDLEK